MVASMTGFGREVREDAGERIEVEIRSVNHRGLKVTVRLADPLAGLLPELEDLVRRRVDRGTVHVDVSYHSLAGERAYSVDADAIRRYVAELAALQKELAHLAPQPIAIERVALLPGAVVVRPAAAQGLEEIFARVKETVERALAALDLSRRREGAALGDDLRRRRAAIGHSLAEVRARIPAALESHRERLRERMRQLLEGVGSTLDPQDLAREVALFADRTDISEEVTRLDAHLAELDRALESDAPVGRRLDFLAQEMLREANTMGSKSQDAALVQAVLAIKLEVDKIKEQVANIE
jgi:uncharacterized protein (TIGR00255 family)